MRKVLTLMIASAFIIAEPLMAMETKAAPSVPQELSALGVTEQDLSDVGTAVKDEPTAAEADILQRRWRNRYCPRGYRLIVERVRIGRFIVTRYRCVRSRYWDDRGRWDRDHRRGDWDRDHRRGDWDRDHRRGPYSDGEQTPKQ
jgi:hypothetical protein